MAPANGGSRFMKAVTASPLSGPGVRTSTTMSPGWTRRPCSSARRRARASRHSTRRRRGQPIVQRSRPRPCPPPAGRAVARGQIRRTRSPPRRHRGSRRRSEKFAAAVRRTRAVNGAQRRRPLPSSTRSRSSDPAPADHRQAAVQAPVGSASPADRWPFRCVGMTSPGVARISAKRAVEIGEDRRFGGA